MKPENFKVLVGTNDRASGGEYYKVAKMSIQDIPHGAH